MFNEKSLTLDNYADNTSLDPDAEAVVYMVTEKGGCSTWMFVMKRSDAVKFCSSDKSQGKGRGGQWHFQFTTNYNFRDHKKEFKKKDDGRFKQIFEDMGIVPIYIH